MINVRSAFGKRISHSAARIIHVGKVLFILSSLLFILVPAAAASSNNQTPLRILCFFDPQAEALFDLSRVFERNTGISVQIDFFDEREFLKLDSFEKLFSRYDLVTIDEPHLMEASPLLVPFKNWPSTQLYGEIDWSNWSTLAIQLSSVNGTLMGIPVNPNLFLYAYRQDLFNNENERVAFEKRYGYPLQIPTNPQMYMDVSEHFHRPPHLYGFSPITSVSEALTIELQWVFLMHDLVLLDDNLETNYNRDEAIRALRYYKKLMDFAPPVRSNQHYDARNSLIAKGRLAHGMTWPAYKPFLLRHEQRLPEHSLSFATGPQSLDGAPLNISGFWTIGIPKTSQQKQNAVEFAHFWSSRSINIALMRRMASPTRTDVLLEPRLQAAVPWRDAYFEALLETKSRPQTPDYRQASIMIAEYFSQYLAGELDEYQALEKIQSSVARIREGLQ